METSLNLDLARVASETGLPIDKVQATVELLDDGNTVPFITRYRKDQTGGLDEEQIRRVQEAVQKWRALADRKQRIVKSLQAQNRLTDELAALIEAADSLRRLEDIYLPFKPKKQTLASLARSRGLEPLAEEILCAAPHAADLKARAADFVNEAAGLKFADDVLLGAGHLIAETISENLDLRDELRKILKSTGKLVSSRIEESAEPESAEAEEDAAYLDAANYEDADEHAHEDEHADGEEHAEDEPGEEQQGPLHEQTDEEHLQSDSAEGEHADDEHAEGHQAEQQSPEKQATEEQLSPPEAAEQAQAGEQPQVEQEHADDEHQRASGEQTTGETLAPELTEAPPPGEPLADALPEPPAAAGAPESADVLQSAEAPSLANLPPQAPQQDAAKPATDAEAPIPWTPPNTEAAAPAAADSTTGTSAATAAQPQPKGARLTVRQLASKTRKESKQRKRQKKIESFKDYFRYQEPLNKIPPHRLLAINRGDRSKILRVRIEGNTEAMFARAQQLLIPADHPHSAFLSNCVRDALNRLIVPSLEREVRRELTDAAEAHAVQVFARNLRKLLLQPPVHNRRVLAVDPGFRSGCKLAALDEFGNVLGHTVIHVIGKEDVVRRGRQQVVEMITMYHIPVIAIGNGTACRETEKLVADVLANELHDRDIRYTIVNEAGASVYSTSSLGRDELPRFDPVLRSTISIGRRLQDPLSELVKITPANIGVGLYQHDVKAKHLQESLDAVVESCVNFVGVDVNTASPALLRYVSGLNQLTARRLYEYRQKHGPFRNRQHFRRVAGFGEATFVQSAGFLKIIGGENPLDATWIHPESYEVAERVIQRLGGNMAELAARVTAEKRATAVASTAMQHFARGVLESSEARAAAAHPESTDRVAPAAGGEHRADAAERPAVSEDAQTPPAPEQAATSEAPPEADAEPAAAAAADIGGAAAPSERDEPAAAPHQAAAAEPQPAAEPEPPAPAEQAAEAPAAAAKPSPADAEPATAAESAAAAAEPPAGRSAAEAALTERAARADAAALARELGIGELLARDILNSLSRPGRDPREDLPQPLFRREVMKLEDLEAGMELSGTVLNVVDFGAFVDIGLPDSGLIHISRLADRFIRDPHEVVSVGDILHVWVVEIDRQRRRVSLTAVQPGTEKPVEQRRERGKREGKPQEERGAKPGGRRGESRRGGGRPPRSAQPKPQPRPAPKPKPVRPITPDMVEGKEPMRSFSDLMQFFEKKAEPEGEEPRKKKKS